MLRVGSTVLVLAALLGCSDAGSEGPRNRIMGTGERTQTAPLTAGQKLLDAVQKNDLTAVKRELAAGTDLYARDGLSNTALIIAARNSADAPLIQVLLEAHGTRRQKADAGRTWLDAVDSTKRSAASWAAQKDRTDILQMLSGHKAHLDSADEAGRTPLFYAALNGSEQAARYLIAQRARLEVRDRYRETPLIAAAARGHTGVVRVLLARGADRTARDQEGRSALDRAKHATVRRLLK